MGKAWVAVAVLGLSCVALEVGAKRVGGHVCETMRWLWDGTGWKEANYSEIRWRQKCTEPYYEYCIFVYVILRTREFSGKMETKEIKYKGCPIIKDSHCISANYGETTEFSYLTPSGDITPVDYEKIVWYSVRGHCCRDSACPEPPKRLRMGLKFSVGFQRRLVKSMQGTKYEPPPDPQEGGGTRSAAKWVVGAALLLSRLLPST